MFFRTKGNKNSKRQYLQLVENYRRGGQSRQKVIASLGVEFEIPKESRKVVADIIERRLLGQKELFDDTPESHIADRIVSIIQSKGSWDRIKNKVIHHTSNEQPIGSSQTATAEVIIDEVSHSHSRILGPLFVGDTFFKRLGFDEILKECGFNGTQIRTAEISILNRLISQDSEYSIPSWIKTSAIGDIIDLKAEEFSEDRFYRISDKLRTKVDLIEERLYEKQRNLFRLKDTVFLYDLTNTYFEGLCTGNSKAAFNKNQKEKRTDCRQIVIALVIDEQGFIRKHHIFGGKQSDAASLEEILNLLEKELNGSPMPTIIMDRGVVSQKNIELMKSKSLKYIVASRKDEELEHIEDFIHAEFNTIREEKDTKIEVLKKQGKEDTVLLCKSNRKKLKEESMRNLAEKRFEQEMEKIKSLISLGKRTNPSAIERMIGRKIQTHSRVSHYYDIIFKPYHFDFDIPQDVKPKSRLINSLRKIKEQSKRYAISHIKVRNKLDTLAGNYPDDFPKISIRLIEPEFKFTIKDEKKEQLNSLDGKYLLKTNREDLSDEEIWNMYVMLTRIEAAFKNLKTDLGLRPNYHHLEKRVEGHIFISILAYHLLHAVEFTLKANGCNKSWQTIKRILTSHIYSTITMPTTKGTVIHLRKPGIPEPMHKEIYIMLGIDPGNLPTVKIEA